jgi:hypothetical protein
MLGKLFGDAKKEEMIKAKQDYEKTCAETGDGRAEVSARIRMGLRCRAVLDKTFIDGAEKTADFTEKSMIAIASGDEKPAAPIPSSFQTIKSVNGEIIGYIPFAFAEEVFKIGAAYQNEEVSAEQSIELCQSIADKISEELKLEPPFQALGFMREDMSEGGEGEGEPDGQSPP